MTIGELHALGELVGARSGDKGGSANVGVWIPVVVPDRVGAYAWLRDWLTVEQVRILLPETQGLVIHRYELANLCALNFVIERWLGLGVSENSSLDPQAKGLGEHIRARLAPIPPELIPNAGVSLA
ncbi:MAG: hypothetical protein WAO40_08410 [Candidatus Nanopelagicales bacterium]|jgi:hypothetical protein|nr:hypothetical protein [Candidatus Nanopelagicales bacterium]MDP4825358.1 hypothetical protein [Candidatus Nanopelagicales bacterium]MDP4887642.1 hypothetical protein [Candidatus Nanopelagicales bacterium]